MKFDEMERQYWASRAAEAKGNVTSIMRATGLARTTVYNKLRRYDLLEKVFGDRPKLPDSCMVAGVFLSRREFQVFGYLRGGLQDKEILTFIAPPMELSTLRAHIRTIHKKFRVLSTEQLLTKLKRRTKRDYKK